MRRLIQSIGDVAPVLKARLALQGRYCSCRLANVMSLINIADTVMGNLFFIKLHKIIFSNFYNNVCGITFYFY